MPETRQSKRGKRLDIPTDLISELPRDAIDAIMERLPLQDAAKMSALSRKWLGIWTSIQTLSFDVHLISSALPFRGFRYKDAHKFCSFVSKILFHHQGNLLRFQLYIPSEIPSPDVNQWICYLSRKGVSEINIESDQKVPLKLSSHIFTCVNLERLKLPYLVINPPYNFGGFSKMTCLELDKPTFTEKSLNCLIKSCPLLTKLSLTNFTVMEHIVINAPRLRWLSVDGTFKSLDVRNAANLVFARFGLQTWVELSRLARLQALLKTLASSCNLQNLGFGGYISKVLYNESIMQTPFAKLRDLELSLIHLNDVDDFFSIVSTIQSCPAIRRLNISVSTSEDVESEVLHYNPDAVLANLCNIDFSVCVGSIIELKLIEFLLNCSPILEKLSITSRDKVITKILQPKAINKLLNCYRASETAEIVI